jgi:hypothetical protein
MLLPFTGPAIGPQSIEEVENFQQLTELRRNLSSAVGWVISARKHFCSESGKRMTTNYVVELIELAPKMDPRVRSCFGALLFFTEMVSS